MIKLTKIEKPQILVDNAVQWTEKYCRCIDNREKPSDALASKYNHPDIKAALVEETHGKCAYCESKVKHITHGDIEHILPKNKNARPDLYVEWSNLTLSCEICNRPPYKAEYYNPVLPLINPYLDDPSQLLQDIGPLIISVLGNEKATITEKKLGLNRTELCERRTDAIMHIETLVQSWHKEQNLEIKEILLHELIDHTQNTQEFSSTIKAYLLNRGVPLTM